MVLARLGRGGLRGLVRISVVRARAVCGLIAGAGRGRRILRFRIFIGAAGSLLGLFFGLCRAGGRIYGSPTAVVPLAPITVGIFFVNVAVGSGVDVIVVGIFSDEAAIAVGAGNSSAGAALGSLKRSGRSVGIGHVLRLRPIVAVGDDGTSPLAVSVVALRSSGVGSGPWIVSLGVGVAAVGILRGDCATVGAGRGIVPSRCADRSVGAVDGAAHGVKSGVGVVNGGDSVGVRIGIINRVARAVIDVRRIVIASAVDDYCADREPKTKTPR